MKVAVLGAGSWGTAIASVVAENGHKTTLWARRREQADEMNQEHRNHRYLQRAILPDTLCATHNLCEAVEGAELIVVAVPSKSVAHVAEDLSACLSSSIPVVAHAVKGFDPDSKMRVSEVLAVRAHIPEEQIAVITGPSHAEEVIAHLPATIVVASKRRLIAETVQDVLMNQYLRVYTNPDVVGAELGGSLKNIIALAVGVADGLGAGDNAKAALMTRGLAEIVRLGLTFGASPLTFAGLSGVGDLIVTCTSIHSRNFRTGRMLGQGKALPEALASIGMAVEGVNSTRIAVELAKKAAVEMPIAQTLHRVLFEQMPLDEAVEALMGRARSHEIEEVAKENLTAEWES
ncbi:NAD(P)H-dependent glycerol-3-phosphate dehydrogenase [Alicyclobacillus sp. SO9]|uniref:NAD(P)H-dependent glycerol-3-phosphate dehydrogenase n=1 Tax=Alicyclobacillus sp. SO9 TaxID=2665646 RepID=UPI0018E8C018|nr:NAD(P)H-dependent glycerol-3-phosphate dehydrogenase [Alicyclobacillus sp. SO9]QQE76825.1 NAD(P)H-dependent glycerol-3-phosphate dehydrogenase [Alicyclobacillus sp. SO9]